MIVMPLAGAGSRFGGPAAGKLPKPLVRVAGRPLVDWAARNLDADRLAKWVFITRLEHTREWPELSEHLRQAGADVTIHVLPSATPSPLHTLHAARHLWEKETGPVLITNCDQFLADPIGHWLQEFLKSDAGIGLLTVEASESHYVHVTVNGTVVTGVPGRVASPTPAAAGYYFFRSGRGLASLVARCLANPPPNREPCVTDLIDVAVRASEIVRAWSLGSVGQRFFPLGDPIQAALYEPQLLKL